MQNAFDSPQQASDALIQAARSYNVDELMAIFGSDTEDLFKSADPVRDKRHAEAFADKAA